MWLLLMEPSRYRGGRQNQQRQLLSSKSEEVRWEMEVTPNFAIVSALLSGCFDAASAALLSAFLQNFRPAEALDKAAKVWSAGLSVHCTFTMEISLGEECQDVKNLSMALLSRSVL